MRVKRPLPNVEPEMMNVETWSPFHAGSVDDDRAPLTERFRMASVGGVSGLELGTDAAARSVEVLGDDNDVDDTEARSVICSESFLRPHEKNEEPRVTV